MQSITSVEPLKRKFRDRLPEWYWRMTPAARALVWSLFVVGVAVSLGYLLAILIIR